MESMARHAVCQVRLGKSASSMRSIKVRDLFLAILLCGAAGFCRADLYGYVDADGLAHFAAEKVDARYQLFARGDRFAALPAAAADLLAPPARLRSEPPAMKRYATMLEQAAREFALEPALLKAIASAESGFDPDAVSPKGAIGLMQVMPATAERYGLVGDARRSLAQKLRDPRTNIRLGARYLADLTRLYPRQPRLVIASYNAGEGAVQQYQHTIPPYRETRDYVELVSALYAAYRSTAASESASNIGSRASSQGKRVLMTIPPGAVPLP